MCIKFINKKMIILTVMVLLMPYTSVHLQTQQDSIIFWNKRKLDWTDFKFIEYDSLKKTEFYTGQKAASAVGIIPSVISIDPIPTYTFVTYFSKVSSYTADTISIELLKHEQLHFDIEEVFCRKLRKGVKLLNSNKETEQLKYIELAKFIYKEAVECQNQYDEETQNALIVEKQQEWNKKIAKELEELKEYAVNYEEYLKDK